MGRTKRVAVGVALLLVSGGCGTFDGDDPSKRTETRVTKLGDSRVISESDPNFRKFEIPEKLEECQRREDCSSAGCSAEVCTTAEKAPEVYTTCSETHPGTQFYCTCVETRCRWKQDLEATP